jgi:hydrogenase maturation protease
MTDDAVGLMVADAIEALKIPNVETMQESIGGLDIIPLMLGYKNVIVVDAIQTKACDPGTIIIFNPEDFAPTIVNASAHEMNLATAISIGRQYDPDGMPKAIRFVAVEVLDILTISESMTDVVTKALPDAIETVLGLIKEFQTSI